MTKEYFYTPRPNQPCEKMCDRCTVFSLCTNADKALDVKLFDF